MVWTHGNEKLDTFIAYLNIHPSIKFTSERSTTSIPFLDVNIQLHNGKIETDLYCKPTDKHQYLLYSSSHPIHTKKSIPYSLALRLRRICSKEDYFNIRATELEQYLTKRGYKNRFIKSQIARAKLIPRNVALNVIMKHPNLPESRSSSRITRPYLTSVTFFTRNNPSSIQQNAYITSSAKRQLWPSVVHLTYAIYWFAPSLKVPKVIHSAILPVLSIAIRDTAVSLALTSMTAEPPTRSAPRVRHGRSNNTSLANQIILLI